MAEAVGTTDPASLDAGAGFFVKQQAAKTAALANLKQQVLSLPVTSENNLAQIVASNLSVRRAVERQLQTAKVVSQQQAAPGTFEARVQLPLKPVADILRQHNISPEGLPPLPESASGDKLPPLS